MTRRPPPTALTPVCSPRLPFRQPASRRCRQVALTAAWALTAVSAELPAPGASSASMAAKGARQLKSSAALAALGACGAWRFCGLLSSRIRRAAACCRQGGVPFSVILACLFAWRAPGQRRHQRARRRRRSSSTPLRWRRGQHHRTRPHPTRVITAAALSATPGACAIFGY